MFSEQGQTFLPHLHAERGINDKSLQGLCQLFRCSHLYPRPPLHYQPGDLLKVFHMRAEDHSLAMGQDLQDVMPPDAREAASHKYGCSQAIEGSELTDGVQQDALWPK